MTLPGNSNKPKIIEKPPKLNAAAAISSTQTSTNVTKNQATKGAPKTAK